MKPDGQYPIWVVLSPKEVERVKKHAEDVQAHNKANIKNEETPLVGKGDRLEYNYHGFAAEYAFSKAAGSKMDWTIYCRKGGKDGTMLNGINYDVKSTNNPNGRLVVHHDNKDVDIFPFCIVEDLFITKIYGYAWRKDLITKKYERAYKGLPGFWMDRSQLYRFQSNGSTILSLDKGDPNMYLEKCKSCGKQIYKLPTKKGKRMPVNAETVTEEDLRKFKAGEEVLYHGVKQGGHHMTHFSDCPQANQHRVK